MCEVRSARFKTEVNKNPTPFFRTPHPAPRTSHLDSCYESIA